MSAVASRNASDRRRAQGCQGGEEAVVGGKPLLPVGRRPGRSLSASPRRVSWHDQSLVSQVRESATKSEPQPDECQPRLRPRRGSSSTRCSEHSSSEKSMDISESALEIDLRNLRGVSDTKLMWHMEVLYSQQEPQTSLSTESESSPSEADDDHDGSFSHVSDVSDVGEAEKARTPRFARSTPRSRARTASSASSRGKKATMEGDGEGEASSRRTGRHRRRAQSGRSPPPGSTDGASAATSGQSRSKPCAKCGSSFSGFGPTCGACRKLGQRGSIVQCQVCDSFFTGYGNSCTDCQTC